MRRPLARRRTTFDFAQRVEMTLTSRMADTAQSFFEWRRRLDSTLRRYLPGTLQAALRESVAVASTLGFGFALGLSVVLAILGLIA